MGPVPYNDEAKKYMTIEYQQTEWDYSARPQLLPKRESRGVRSCTEKDMRTK